MNFEAKGTLKVGARRSQKGFSLYRVHRAEGNIFQEVGYQGLSRPARIAPRLSYCLHFFSES